MDAIYSFCKVNIEGVEFFDFQRNSSQCSAFVESLYAAGSCFFHHFALDPVGVLQFKRISDDEECTTFLVLFHL